LPQFLFFCPQINEAFDFRDNDLDISSLSHLYPAFPDNIFNVFDQEVRNDPSVSLIA